METTYTLQELCNAFDIDHATLWRWLQSAGITPQEDSTNKRRKILSLADALHLAVKHHRQIPDSRTISFADSLQHPLQDTVHSLQEGLQDARQSYEEVAEKVKRLEDELAEVKKQLAALLAIAPQPPIKVLRPPKAVYTPDTERDEKAPAVKTEQEPLPEGFVTLTPYAKMHQFTKRSTWRDDIAKGRLPALKGEWLVQGHWEHHALDAAGQARFHELYALRGIVPSDDCELCQSSTLPAEFTEAQAFADLHAVSRNETQQRIRSGFIATVKGVWNVGTRFVGEALDAKGRRDFWVQFHKTEGYRSCDDCPHSMS